MNEQKAHIVIFKTSNGKVSIEVHFEAETVWLSLDQMTMLFDRDKSTIFRHIKNVLEEEELVRDAVVAKFATTAADGKVYHVDSYNLDVISSVGNRVKSPSGTQFRIWATKRLNEYIRKGFTLDDERLKKRCRIFQGTSAASPRHSLQDKIQLFNAATQIYTPKSDDRTCSKSRTLQLYTPLNRHHGHCNQPERVLPLSKVLRLNFSYPTCIRLDWNEVYGEN